MVANSRTLESGSVTSMRSSRGICAAVVKVFLAVLLGSVVQAQNLHLNGPVTNTGTLRVKGQVNGMPAAMDGVFEYFGANQNVPASTYKNLVLSGSGTKTTVGGNFTVQQDITITAPVTLKIPAPDLVTLGGTLTESGYLEGSIARTVDLSGGTTSSNFGNIGGTISWMNAAPGLTTVRRSSGTAVVGRDSNESIKRFYDITAAVNSGLNASFEFRYENSELNGQDSTKLLLWRSIDNGTTWFDEGGIVDPVVRKIIKTGITSLNGRWTAADSAHALGQFGLSPTNLLYLTGNNQIDTINAILNPFIVGVTDRFGIPVPGHSITFAIASKPPGAIGDSLTVTNAVTDDSGRASTVLTLGNKIGAHIVTATAPGLINSPLTFTSTAIPGAAVQLAQVSGNNQTAPINRPLANALVVRVSDRAGNPISGRSLTFAITSTPPAAAGQSLSVLTTATDDSGKASTVLTMGNKVGQYSVAATSAGLVGSPTVFVATATAGNPAVITEVSGNNQTAPVLTTLNPFVVVIRDSGDNPVPNALVTFTIASVPPGATGQRLSVFTIATDDSGRAYSVLTLGNTVGTYSVTVTSTQLSGQQILFSSQALPGTPAILSEVSGNGQSAPINRPLTSPFIVVVRDSSNNPIPGVSIQFAITGVPEGATGQNLSTSSATTNENGFASTLLTLGNKVGTYFVTTSSSALPGVQTIFNTLATHGTPAVLAQVSGNNQDTSINTQLANPFVIAIKDSGDNPVPGVPVVFSIQSTPLGATGQSLSTTNAMTDSLGRASTFLMLGSKVGIYTVRASLQDGNNGVLFTAQATAGAATAITPTSGNNQNGYIGEPLVNPFVVTVTDIGGNPVPNVEIQFAITAAPNGATGQSLSTLITNTDSTGRASTILTIGDKVGVYTVTASAPALPDSAERDVTFTANALVIIGDANNDREANVADLTAIIDHILGRRLLTGTAFIRADINYDGRVDIRDAVLLVNYILYDTWDSTSTPAPSERPRTTTTSLASSQANVQATLEVSPLGLRFNLTNDVPVKGIQTVLRVNKAVHLDSANYIFPRGLAMTVPATSDSLGQVRVLAFNFENKEIEAGQGAVFRLPIDVADTTQFEIVDVIVSALDNTGLRIPATKTMPSAEQYPAAYKLEQNYPNPFNRGTTIRYEIPDRMYAIRHIEIEIFNILGQKVKTLVRGQHDAGRYTVTWDGTNNAGSVLPSGVYFYRIVSWDFVNSKKMILLK